MTRGSAWAKCKFWLINRDGTISRRSIGIEYGYSETRDVNTAYQRSEQLRRAINKAKASYLDTQGVTSDTECNYRLLASGIQTVRIQDGQGQRIAWRRTRLTSVQKRKVHQIVQGKDRDTDKPDDAKADISPRKRKDYKKRS